MPSQPFVSPPSPAPVRSPAAVVGFLVVVELIAGVWQGLIPAVMPAIGAELGVSTAALGWIYSIFLLSSALWVPVLTKLGDMYGHRKMLRVSVVALAAGSVVVALAPSYPVLLAGRVLQGALLCFLPLDMALVRDRLTKKQARSGIAILIGALTFGGSIGAVLGGTLLEVSVSLALWVPAVATVACIAVPFLLVPESVTRAPSGTRLDWRGAVLIAVGLGSGMVALALGPASGWSNPLVVSLSIGSIAVLVWWWKFETRQAHPLIAVRLLARRAVLPLYLGAAAVGMTMFAPITAFTTFVATPSDAGYGFGATGLQLGFFGLAYGGGAFVGSFLAPRIAPKWGQMRTVLAGFVLIALSFAGTVVLGSSLAGTIGSITLAWLGMGVVMSVLPAMILERLPQEQAGTSAGVYNILRTLGGSVLGAVFAAVLAGATPDSSALVSASGYTAVFVITAVIAVAGAVVTAVSAKAPETTTAP